MHVVREETPFGIVIYDSMVCFSFTYKRFLMQLLVYVAVQLCESLNIINFCMWVRFFPEKLKFF